MRILITGASGFIGGHVLKLLTKSRHDVIAFDISQPGPVAASVRDDVQLIEGNISNLATVDDVVASVRPDCIIHLASLLVPDCRANPRKAFEVNVGGTINILEAAQSHGVNRVVAGSSVNVYGNSSPSSEYITEATVREPDSTYAMTKYAIEWLGSSSEVEFAALESVHGFGPDRIRGNSYDAAVVKAAVSDIPINVPQTGIRDEFLYVKDCARAFVTAATSSDLSYDRYLVGTNQHATLSDIVDLVSTIVPEVDIQMVEANTDRIWTGDRNNHPPTDSTRIQTDMGWEPRYSLQEMVERYVAWLTSNPDAWTFTREDIPWE